MSYLQYKPVNKRFKEFLGIILATGISGFIGMAIATLQSETTEISTTDQEFITVMAYGFIGAIVGLIVSVLVVNTSTKKD